MHTKTKRVITIYGFWASIWVLLAATGYGDPESGQIMLLVSGFPFALLSLDIMPNGSVLATFAAGALGCIQWGVLAEANVRFNRRRRQATDRRAANENK